MNDPVTLLQLIIGLLVAVVPLAVAAGTLLRDVAGIKENFTAHTAEDKAMSDSVQAHAVAIVALERDAHAARNREQATMMQIAAMSGKLDDVRDVVTRIDERLSRDDTSPRKRERP